jgi:type IV pilus assembly protein PilN
MTTRINLLPWREWRRKRLQREFILQLVLAAILGAAIWFFWNSAVSARVEGQERRNAYIEEQIGKLDDKIKQIEKLEERRSELVERMKVIQELQGNRPTIVYLFDRLVKTLPEGVYYTSVERNGKQFSISGVSESNNRISRLMRNLEESRWFEEPNLQNVSAEEDQQDGGGDTQDSQRNQFQLTVSQANPREQGDGSDAGGQEGGQS